MTDAPVSKRSPFSVPEYLERINCPLDVNPSLRYLKKLHLQHLLHVPFENMDNFLGNEIILDIDRIYKKIVQKRRGGFCYELNGLFYTLLKKLGFEVDMVSARVYDTDGVLRQEFDHMALIVHLDERQYLVDVGFGDYFRQPKNLTIGEVQMDNNKYYRLDKNIDDVYTISSSTDTINYRQDYSFTLVKRSLVEFIDMCYYHHRNKESHLVRRRYITQATREGQKTLTWKKLTISHLGETTETAIQNGDDFKVKLFEHFQIRYIVNR